MTPADPPPRPAIEPGQDRPDPAAWRRALEDASCLPPGDPERLAVERDVVARGGFAEREWLSLLEEGERLRIELQRVEVPAQLEAALLRDAGIPPRTIRASRLRTGLLAAAAAVVLLVVGWVSGGGGPSKPDPLSTLALLALTDHLDTHDLEVTSGDPVVLEHALRGRIPFTVRLPALGRDAVLEGGRRCTLGSHVVCFSAWRLGGARATLIQLRPEQFGVSPSLSPTIVRADGAAAGRAPLDVLIWADGEFGYALIADESRMLHGRVVR
ncbi:MAG: hypothetical protein JNM10_15105 [Planctomycetia bacterium]|nr:hypothetical protein [Planctomycetia bacterium]